MSTSGFKVAKKHGNVDGTKKVISSRFGLNLTGQLIKVHADEQQSASVSTNDPEFNHSMQSTR